MMRYLVIAFVALVLILVCIDISSNMSRGDECTKAGGVWIKARNIGAVCLSKSALIDIK